MPPWISCGSSDVVNDPFRTRDRSANAPVAPSFPRCTSKKKKFRPRKQDTTDGDVLLSLMGTTSDSSSPDSSSCVETTPSSTSTLSPTAEPSPPLDEVMRSSLSSPERLAATLVQAQTCGGIIPSLFIPINEHAHSMLMFACQTSNPGGDLMALLLLGFILAEQPLLSFGPPPAPDDEADLHDGLTPAESGRELGRAFLDLVDSCGCSAVHWAAQGGRLSLLRVLFSALRSMEARRWLAECDPASIIGSTRRDVDPASAIAIQFVNQHLKRGDICGATPLDCARRAGHGENSALVDILTIPVVPSKTNKPFGPWYRELLILFLLLFFGLVVCVSLLAYAVIGTLLNLCFNLAQYDIKVVPAHIKRGFSTLFRGLQTGVALFRELQTGKILTRAADSVSRAADSVSRAANPKTKLVPRFSPVIYYVPFLFVAVLHCSWSPISLIDALEHFCVLTNDTKDIFPFLPLARLRHSLIESTLFPFVVVCTVLVREVWCPGVLRRREYGGTQLGTQRALSTCVCAHLTACEEALSSAHLGDRGVYNFRSSEEWKQAGQIIGRIPFSTSLGIDDDQGGNVDPAGSWLKNVRGGAGIKNMFRRRGRKITIVLEYRIPGKMLRKK